MIVKEMKSKEDFVKYAKLQINAREVLKSFYLSEFMPAVKKFNGKQYTKAFQSYLQDRANSYIFKKYMDLGQSEDHPTEINVGKAKIERQHYNNFTDMSTVRNTVTIVLSCCDEELVTKLYETVTGSFLEPNFRINAQATESTMHDAFRDYDYEGITADYQDSIDHYDSYVTVIENMCRAIDDFNFLPQPFRMNFRTRYVKIYGK